MSSQRIGIVGSGIAGLTAAHLLARKHDVSVFEANDYIGGHTHTVPVEMEGEQYEIDTGFIVCNDRNYPNFLKFMDQIGVSLQPTEMSFSVRNDSENLEYNGHNLNTLFAQRINLLRPRFIRLVSDILNFNKASKAAIARQQIEDITLDEFLAQQKLGDSLRLNYLLPMVAAIWSCSVEQAGQFPLAFFLRFFLNHGLLDIKNRPQWYVLKGGSHAYIAPMTDSFRDRIRLSSPVRAVTRNEASVSLTTDAGSETFDQVIFACHSDQALALLQDASEQENEVLGAIAYQDNSVILHTDVGLMPKRKLAWASWNFLAGETATHELPLVTYSMNILQGVQSPEPFLVSLNAKHKINPDKILQEFVYAHPVHSTASSLAQARRDKICGHKRTHFCGAYWYNGFHEDGVRSALDVAERFGESL
ncbi:MAG TPA: FAD-dependent oxidoreductase [Gammaproteobacteria bacterium]|mgnify:FL=1|uniref:FAD-dependent oxidoreductase n=1 Tax=OM182 bacterium TaxID=2510334 RepID=A0A520S362_9GAMM|nr:MAG: FAD-dependent oxidoreductase [Gammaproteobacteria bacterium TMED163]RZO76915.1 MAG: FAD-dependent oxidoreductase [OM182 bacterium]HAO89468.1 FAD-dependent oxidoreductase [Gammaproteobacteria bacterium]HAU23935.1 FAD-dependent oxidoreductase [Gammaproteobacteria bacterium]